MCWTPAWDPLTWTSDITSKAKPWAAYETSLKDGDVKVDVLVGPICDECWAIANDVLGYSSVGKFIHEHNKSQALRDRVEIIRASLYQGIHLDENVFRSEH